MTRTNNSEPSSAELADRLKAEQAAADGGAGLANPLGDAQLAGTDAAAAAALAGDQPALGDPTGRTDADATNQLETPAEASEHDTPETAAALAAFARIGIAPATPEGDVSPDQLISAVNGVADRIEALEAENSDLKKQIADRDAVAAKGKSSPRAHASAPSRRKVAPVKVKKGEEAELAPVDPEDVAALHDQVRDADQVEIVFSDGQHEIEGLPALTVEGEAWKPGINGLQLTGVPVLVHGPGPLQQSISLHGYGLLLDGKQVAYRARPDGELKLGAGQQYDLSGDIVF